MALLARNGTPKEKYEVGLAYWERGSYNFPNLQEAARWMEASARSGDAEAQRQLAWMYLSRSGVPFDPDNARYWMKKAAQQGNPGAVKDFEYIEKMYPR
jgi:TPR repeat protein